MRRRPSRRLLFGCALLLLLMAVTLVLRQTVSIERIIAVETQLRDHVQRYPVSSFGVGMLVYTLLSLVPGTSGKAIVFGWLYGFWLALVLVNVGLTIAAVISFLLSRYVFRQAIQSRFAYTLERFDNAVRREGAFLVIGLRLMHVPFTFVNYTMGTTSMRTKTFWWASQVGMLPGCIVFVLAGAQLPTLNELVTRGMPAIFTPGLMTALALMALFPFVARRFVRTHAPR
jgi:uncharacterized membrane protein YdjX (TVP38/TMEM64 family)